MSFFSAFDNTKPGRHAAKFRNKQKMGQYWANVTKYSNKKMAFASKEDERVLSLSRDLADQNRQVLKIRGQANTGKEQAYKKFSQTRRGPEEGRSTRFGRKPYEQLLNQQANLEAAVSFAAGETASLQRQAILRKDLGLHRKNIGALGVPARNPIMEPYQKENKFMTFMNFTKWAVDTGANLATGYNTIQDAF